MSNQEIYPGHYHEIADRCHIINCMIDDHVIGHPGMNEQMEVWARAAQELLYHIMNFAWYEQEQKFPEEKTCK